MVLEVIEVHSSVAFEFCIDEEFLVFWLDDFMFEIPHATIFCKWPPSNGEYLFLFGTEVVGSWSFGESFISDEYFENLIWSVID